MKSENKFSPDFDPKAFEDYQASIVWYDEQSTEVAIEFITEVEKALETICQNPFRFKNIFQEYHEYALKRFPFVIVYEIDEGLGLIYIYAIYHQKRHPDNKYR